MVIEGPDYEDEYDKIQLYLNECDWLPNNINILTSSIDYGPHESIYTRPQSYEERMILKDYYDPILSWDKKIKKGIKIILMSYLQMLMSTKL